MISKSDLERVRQQIEQHIGAEIRITAKRGRKRVVVRHGTINAVYPFTFNVTLEGVSAFAETSRNVSLNYADILTESINILLIESGEEIR
ncbi:MAG: Veg family protein [Clostridia bacterium]|nr:Veg family protein [Clostridia bacterium]